MVQSSFDLIFSRFQMAISALQFALKVDLKANVQALDVPGCTATRCALPSSQLSRLSVFVAPTHSVASCTLAVLSD